MLHIIPHKIYSINQTIKMMAFMNFLDYQAIHTGPQTFSNVGKFFKMKSCQPCQKNHLFRPKWNPFSKFENKYEKNTYTFFSRIFKNFDLYPITIKKYFLQYEPGFVCFFDVNVVPSFPWTPNGQSVKWIQTLYLLRGKMVKVHHT